MIIPACKPRYILAVYLAMCAVFMAVAIPTKGAVSIAFLILVFCAESACFACIFATGMLPLYPHNLNLNAQLANPRTGLRGLGRHTKRGGSLLVAAISGATVFTPATGAVMDHSNASIAMVIPLTGYVLAWIYPLYINVWNKELMDSHRATTVGLAENDGKNDLEKSVTNDHCVEKETALHVN